MPCDCFALIEWVQRVSIHLRPSLLTKVEHLKHTRSATLSVTLVLTWSHYFTVTLVLCLRMNDCLPSNFWIAYGRLVLCHKITAYLKFSHTQLEQALDRVGHLEHKKLAGRS
ncbi:hypothetical protein BV22DRAFT_243592 [Leucogyrophana mollusca]|uniref:Uncharacterized protein n=1 Tax=Leucogyrophana mollusca TaxID=85980 RepID=A0ACB8BPX0_9AGAM|nr:hypothetical protein BV22DRAFT_243592 [Leucogyrophana mollusca]